MVEYTWTRAHFEKMVTEVITARYDFQVEKVLHTLEHDLLLHLKVTPRYTYIFTLRLAISH
jgi:hypothetical protein